MPGRGMGFEEAVVRTRRERQRNRLAGRLARWTGALAVSLAAQLLVLLFFVSAFTGGRSLKVEPTKPVALRALPQAAWEQNRKIGPRPAPKPEEGPLAKKEPEPAPDKPKKDEPEAIPKGKVVDVAPGNGQKPDEDARFLAESNNRVEKETRSRDATPFYKNAMPRPSSPTKPSPGKGNDLADREVIAGNGGKGNDDAPAKDAPRRGIFELPRLEQRDELALRFDGLGGQLRNRPGSEELRGNSDRLRIQAGGPDGSESTASAGRAGEPELRTLAPSATVLDRIAGAPANDVTPMDDVEFGDGTFLNTREWKHSSFFNRVKQNIGMHWNPNSVIVRKDPTNELFLYKDRLTVLTVTLDSRGNLKTATVNKSSGVEFLDREAMAALQRAQPFPNPPPALLDDHGEISFPFGFYLEVGRGMFRRQQ